MELACKSVKETSLMETLNVERDKPHKRETQINGRGTCNSELKRFAGHFGADK